MVTTLGLPQSARLRKAGDFQALRSARGRVRGRYFLLRYDIGCGDGPRLGMAVSRKVSHRAVDRNRIKRQIRESYRHHRDELPDVDVLVIAHRDARNGTGEALRQDLQAAWRRMKSLQPRGTVTR